MERFNNKTGEDEEIPKVDVFINEIIDICKKHGYSIAHEDCHGAFLIHGFDQETADWLKHAHYYPY